ncbi:heat shock protein DnaJ domain protein [Nitzschia inconspicua]|uniref:Heat shock protein DnaJ domain protein n=1 Tax=Nitzschia inconspicua TaxID=303405 RepID=A0A9K3Q3W2_9STRA|nr:heat shock protein DnaJ domain protein [Nitzschia inconspicua]
MTSSSDTTPRSTKLRTVPSEAMMILLAPDGYYTYLQIPKSFQSDSSTIFTITNSSTIPLDMVDLIKKNYRKLSIKHHPDKPGGDVDTFRLLKRAQTVLSSPKLKQQYDILGLDLDDDEDEVVSMGHDDDDDNNHSGDSTATTNTTDDTEPQTILEVMVHEITYTAINIVLQLSVRTAILAFASVFVTRDLLLLFLALAILVFDGYQIRTSQLYTVRGLDSPIVTGTGLIIMYKASVGSWSRSVIESDTDNSTTSTDPSIHFWLYWIGESMVIFMVTHHALGPSRRTTPIVISGAATFGVLAALWFRGKFWNYIIVLLLEVFMACFILVSFPIVEMILEAVLDDKLKKMGDKVRAKYAYMERYYASKRKVKD